MRIFATSFNSKERPRESAFSLFRLTVKLGHFHRNVKSRNKANGCSLVLYSYCTTYNKWGSFKKPYLLFTTMGVQALRSEIGRNGWLHFLRICNPHRAVNKIKKMAKKDECSRCSKGRRTSHGGDLYCSHLGHSIQFDGISCPHFYSKIQRCPKCGQMVNIALATCPQCGHTLKQNTAHIDVPNTASKNISKNKTTKSTAKPVLIFLLIAAVVALIICLVCWNNQKEAAQKAEAKAARLDSIQNAEKERVSAALEAQRKAEEERIERERLKRERLEQERIEQERLEQERYSWMDGVWYLSLAKNDPYAGRITFRVKMIINTSIQSIRFLDQDSHTGYSGTYTIDESDNIISCKGNYVKFDPGRQMFYEEIPDEWGFKKRFYYHQ